MNNLRTYFTKTRVYKGGALGVAAIGVLATLAGGSASAMSYTASYSQNSFSSYNNQHNHHRHDHRRDHRMRRYY